MEVVRWLGSVRTRASTAVPISSSSSSQGEQGGRKAASTSLAPKWCRLSFVVLQANDTNRGGVGRAAFVIRIGQRVG